MANFKSVVLLLKIILLFIAQRNFENILKKGILLRATITCMK